MAKYPFLNPSREYFLKICAPPSTHQKKGQVYILKVKVLTR